MPRPRSALLVLLTCLLAAAGCGGRAASLDAWLDAETRSCLDAIAFRAQSDKEAGDPYRDYLFRHEEEGKLRSLLDDLRSVRDERRLDIKDVRARHLMRRKVETCLMLISSIRRDETLRPRERRWRLSALEKIVRDTVALYAAED